MTAGEVLVMMRERGDGNYTREERVDIYNYARSMIVPANGMRALSKVELGEPISFEAVDQAGRDVHGDRRDENA